MNKTILLGAIFALVAITVMMFPFEQAEAKGSSNVKVKDVVIDCSSDASSGDAIAAATSDALVAAEISAAAVAEAAAAASTAADTSDSVIQLSNDLSQAIISGDLALIQVTYEQLSIVQDAAAAAAAASDAAAGEASILADQALAASSAANAEANSGLGGISDTDCSFTVTVVQ